MRDPDSPSIRRPVTAEFVGAPTVLFSSLQAATDAFALHLNRDPLLADFRDERARGALQNRVLSGRVAAEFMANLAPENPELVSQLIAIIREYRLDEYDLARLGGVRRAVPVL